METEEEHTTAIITFTMRGLDFSIETEASSLD